MNTITSLLESFEKLAYKFLLAIIFVPKTIVQIVTNPGWVTEYIREQLNKKDSPFNEYISPVMLLLAVALIPAIAISFLPTLGTSMTPELLDDSGTSRWVRFEADTRVVSASKQIYNQYSWNVIRTIYDKNGISTQELVYKETYNELSNKTVIEEPGVPARVIEGFWNTELLYPNTDYNTAVVNFYYEFEKNTNLDPAEYTVNFETVSFDPDEIRDDEGGNYFENLDAAIFDPNGNNKQFILERYSSKQTAQVPAANEEDQRISFSGAGTRAQDNTSTSGNISDILKKETTIFLALGLLLPPLIFALATKLFTGVDISETSLKESFYTQCYYFSPLSLAIWATYYAFNFLTPDVFFYKGEGISSSGVFLPSILAILWFIGVEIDAIRRERPTKTWKAALIITACIAILGFGGYRAFLFSRPYSDEEDLLRRLAILIYPVASAALLIAFVALWWRRKENEKKISRGEFMVGLTIFFIIASAIVVFQLASMGQSISEASAPIEIPMATEPPAIEIPEMPAATEEILPTSPTDTPVPEVQPFYTEEFDGTLDSWFPFLTNGLEDQVAMNLENGNLVFKITPHEDKLPYFYLINQDFVYEDVQLEAVVTNNGNNANGITLVCRYSEFGWYEFTVSSAGLYEIYAFDASGAVKQGYNLLANGGSGEIKPGFATNLYTAVCKGNELTLLANGTPVKTVTDTTYNFIQGQIGIGVSSREPLPVDLQFESLAISQPQ